MRAWVIFSTDAGSAVTAQIASDLLEPTITARPRTDRLKHRPLEKSWRCRAARLRFGAKLLKSLALPRGLEPLFSVRGRGSGPSKYSGEVNHSGVAPIEGSCSAIGLHLLIEPVTRTAGVVERGHAVAIGARRAGDAACAVVECRDAVGVGSGR